MHLFNNHVIPSLLFSLLGIVLFTSAVPVYNDNYCLNTATYQSSITFQSNLKILLSDLTSNASQGRDGYYLTNIGLATINVASGIFLCRDDVSSAICQECVAAAATEIKRRCHNQTQSIIWYDECTLGYTNRYFNPVSIVPRVNLWDDKNISTSDLKSFNQTLFNLLNSLAEEAASSQLAKKFATGETEFKGSSRQNRVYGLAQCVLESRPKKIED
ncbi:putative cysteine-rich receptor-like protein kinase 9 [Gastrolobium bilobum]|uniref:putative cysteine-rich receptor-like protein kinase 9 n=1 Tax=Gastrolobium bilobum TaxID=150636 RepID=UPI002AB27C54|nr:putative cysteine-rich receptor-like protein kinase 9 [Gastrolobium bilobum]